jgi:hypothetical protein
MAQDRDRRCNHSSRTGNPHPASERCIDQHLNGSLVDNKHDALIDKMLHQVYT